MGSGGSALRVCNGLQGFYKIFIRILGLWLVSVKGLVHSAAPTAIPDLKLESLYVWTLSLNPMSISNTAEVQEEWAIRVLRCELTACSFSCNPRSDRAAFVSASGLQFG